MTTISDIKAANRAAGYHFFDADAMRFFDARVDPDVYVHPNGEAFFVTSEQFHGSTGSAPRGWTVRVAKADGNVDPVDGFQHYDDAESAHEAARAYSRR